jgi:hypothetical protein
VLAWITSINNIYPSFICKKIVRPHVRGTRTYMRGDRFVPVIIIYIFHICKTNKDNVRFVYKKAQSTFFPLLYCKDHNWSLFFKDSI